MSREPHRFSLRATWARLAVIGGASAFQMACLTVLSLVLARVMEPEDFGVTRTIAAYFLVALMFGHLCLHDGISTYVAGAVHPDEKHRWIFTGSIMVVAASVGVTLIGEVVILSGWVWQGTLRTSMAVVFAFLPFAALTVVYNQLLQALGEHRKMAISLAVGGLAPLVMIGGGAWLYGLEGWTLLRGGAYLALAVMAWWLVRAWVVRGKPERVLAGQLWRFIQFQFASGLVSMMLQSADVMALDRLLGRMDQIGYYSLGIMFSNASIFILHTIDRVYFKELSDAHKAGEVFWSQVGKLAMITLAFCLVMIAGINLVGPWFIRAIFGEVYTASIPILRISSVGLLFSGFWALISMVNVILKTPRFSLLISGVGLGTAILLLLVWTPRWGIRGAAWSMNAAYAAGVLTGALLLARFRRLQMGRRDS